METLIREIYSEHNLPKQKELIIKFLEAGYFTYPSIAVLLSEFRITPQELKKKNSLSDEISTPSNLKDSQLSYNEARRLAKIDILAELIQSRGIFLNKSVDRSKHSLFISPLRCNKSYKSILESRPDIPLTIPLNHEIHSQRLIDNQYKKLDRLLKVSDNIKQLKFEEEKKKIYWSKELEEKLEKIKKREQIIEEERARKRQENESKRQSKLKKKYEDNVHHEIKVLEDSVKLNKSKSKHDRSKTSLNPRSVNYRDSEDERQTSRFESMKPKLYNEIAKETKSRTKSVMHPSREDAKLARAQEIRSQLSIKEIKKAQQIMENLNSTLELSRRKRKVKLLETAEKINEVIVRKFEKVKNENLKEEEKLSNKEREFEKKEADRERVRKNIKDWYVQQGLILAEINKIRKHQQSKNLKRNKADLTEFKQKILSRHLSKVETLKKIDNDKSKLEKLRYDAQATLVSKKHQNLLDLHERIAVLHKSNKYSLPSLP